MTGASPLTPPFATKVAVVVRDDLETWQRLLNVTALLVGGVTAARPRAGRSPVRGRRRRRTTCACSAFPCWSSRPPPRTLAQRPPDRARRSDRSTSRSTPATCSATGHDADNRAVVTAAAPGSDLDLVA